MRQKVCNGTSQNSQQILNWFASAKEKKTKRRNKPVKQTQIAARNMSEKRAVHALIHNTQCTHTHIHMRMQMVLLPLLFFVVSFFHVYWYYYGAMLCNICKFLLLLPTTVFPQFFHPQPKTLPLAVLTFVGIIPHIVAAGVFCFVYFSLTLLLCFYYIICSI